MQHDSRAKRLKAYAVFADEEIWDGYFVSKRKTQDLARQRANEMPLKRIEVWQYISTHKSFIKRETK